MVESLMLKKESRNFADSDWNEVVRNVSVSFNVAGEELERLRNSPVAKLIAAMPFIAGCKNPDQQSVFKVGIYVGASRNPGMFAHRDNQTTRERLGPAVFCLDGDPLVVELVTTFLELISINDHIVDYEDDLKTGHPNPIGSNIILYFSRREFLRREIENADRTLVRRLMKIADPIAVCWWNP